MFWPLFAFFGYHALPGLFKSTSKPFIFRRFCLIFLPTLLLSLFTAGGTHWTPQEAHLRALIDAPYSLTLYGHFAPLLALVACDALIAFIHALNPYFFTMPWKRRKAHFLFLLPLCFLPYLGSPLAYVLGLMSYKHKLGPFHLYNAIKGARFAPNHTRKQEKTH